ncbi:tyrosine-type recombinase/integrase [Natrarchaeobius chitinivorans]|uniref:Site-specific integrase n=2 Tax=Natrarchaeobius chitinivorans TaxID=1679083 RepID=A0A3N6LN36_NATCH|nr:tyrosine-type recombinase/integrase [Natrarchaeobius chitinivorans]RQG89347.1 site-specific integrase [Natrarchaeobius chitinivorans]
MSEDLEPLSPAEAVNLYLNHREPELSEKSIQNQRYRLNSFIDWCQETGFENMNDLSGRDLHRFRSWRQKEDVATITLRSQLATLRVFLEFCANIDAVEPGLRERVLLPEVDSVDESRDIKLEEDHANRLLDYLEKFDYASRDHVIVAILWHTGIRLGSLRAFDLNDFDPDDQCLELRHRPETGTRLKNGSKAKRAIAVGETYCRTIQDYIDTHRDSVTDDYGRHPLITSTHGRLSSGAIRATVYKVTRPCLHDPCPHNRDPTTCEYMDYQSASGCPSSRSPHGIRRGSITNHLRDGTPEEIVGDRMNVSSDVLEQHYDRRTEREKMELRRQFIKES